MMISVGAASADMSDSNDIKLPFYSERVGD